jgi:hypothetical protein
MSNSKVHAEPSFDQSDENPLYYRDDEAWVHELIQELIDRRLFVRRPSKYQLKHRAVNYYPSTDVITIDGQGRHSETGAQAFLDLLEKMYPKRQRSGRLPPRDEEPPQPLIVVNLELDDDKSHGIPANDNLNCSEDTLPW